MLVRRYIPTIVWLVAFFEAWDLSLRIMVVHYTNAILYLMPFIGAWGLPPPVERCIPALVVYLYPAMFGIAQGAPTPGCMPALVTLLGHAINCVPMAFTAVSPLCPNIITAVLLLYILWTRFTPPTYYVCTSVESLVYTVQYRMLCFKTYR